MEMRMEENGYLANHRTKAWNLELKICTCLYIPIIFTIILTRIHDP